MLARLSAGGVAAFTVRTRLPPARRAPPARYGARRAGGGGARVSRRTHRVDQELEHRHPGGRPGAAVGRTGRGGAGVRGCAGLRSHPRSRHGRPAMRTASTCSIVRTSTRRLSACWARGARRSCATTSSTSVPATDDRPYFRSFSGGRMRARSCVSAARADRAARRRLPRAARRAGAGGRGKRRAHPPAGCLRCAGHASARGGGRRSRLSCIGLAFLLIGIAFIGRFTDILSHPVHALVVVLAGFLVFAGVGSHLSARRGGPDSFDCRTRDRHCRVGHRLRLALTATDLRPDRRAPGGQDRRRLRPYRPARDADGHAVSPRTGTAEHRRPVASTLGVGASTAARRSPGGARALAAIHHGHAWWFCRASFCTCWPLHSLTGWRVSECM